jgi:hypothetical protein
MYAMRCTVTHEAVGPHFWTESAARAAWGQSELLEVVSTPVDYPGSLDRGLRARRVRRNVPFDPQGHYRRRVENLLAALESEFRTGSRALWEFYLWGGPRPEDSAPAEG